MMDWSKRPMFRNAANMMGGGYVPLPRMQEGTGPGGVSPELFSPAEFMGSPLNEMTQAPGFFPQGNFGGGAPSSENTGIQAGFLDEEELASEELAGEGIINEARMQAMQLFDQAFKELMAIFQAETAAGGVAPEEIEMTLDEELEVIEGQAEAQVKEMMDLPEEVDLIPAEVVENYRQKAQTALFSPEMGAEPMMEEIPRMQTGAVVEEETDPLAILEAQRAAATARLDARKSAAAGEATTREQDLRDRIKRGEFSQVATDWGKLDKMVDRVKDIARREGETKSYLSPAVSTMGGKWLEALTIRPKMGKLAGDKAALNFEMEIEKLKQAEQQAINSGDAGMLKDVYLQGQKIQDSLTNTLLGDVGDIEAKAITGVEDILTKQIGDEGYTDTWRTDQYWLSVLEDPNSTDLQKRVAEQALGIGTGKGDIPTRVAEIVKLADAAWKGYEGPAGGTMGYDQKVKTFEQEFKPILDFHGSTVLPTDPLFYDVVKAYIEAQSVSAPATQTSVIDVSNLSKEQVQEAISKGFYPSGTILKTDAGQITVP